MPPPVPRPPRVQRCRWNTPAAHPGPAQRLHSPEFLHPAQHTASPALHSAADGPPAPCGTCPRRNRARPPAPGQKTPAGHPQCGQVFRSAPLHWARPCVPDCFSGYPHELQRIRCSPAHPGPAAPPPAGCFCRRARRTCPAHASRAAHPAAVPPRTQTAPASRTRPHGGTDAARAGISNHPADAPRMPPCKRAMLPVGNRLLRQTAPVSCAGPTPLHRAPPFPAGLHTGHRTGLPAERAPAVQNIP